MNSATATPPPGRDLASVRLRGLDRSHRVAGFYRRVEIDPEHWRLKEIARLAAPARTAAVHDGDYDLAAATLARFRAATDRLAPGVARLRKDREVAA